MDELYIIIGKLYVDNTQLSGACDQMQRRLKLLESQAQNGPAKQAENNIQIDSGVLPPQSQ